VSRRGVVSDYAGEGLYAGDLITYGVRAGNRVRMSDAVIKRVTARISGGRLRPMLLVQPTGVESGFGLTKRKTLREQWISAEHVRLIHSGVMSELAEGDG
jgi:hypothetical protein